MHKFQFPIHSALFLNRSLHPKTLSTMTCPVPFDGSDQDLMLSRSRCLTRAEVLARRARRIKQLAGIYRDHYWALMEEVRRKHRDYWWECGESPFDDPKTNNGDCIVKDENGVGGDEGGLVSVGKTCVVQRCELKAMALTSYCRLHIVRDNQQRLYKPCEFLVVNKLPDTAGSTQCGNSTLKSVIPAYCNLHYQLAEEYMLCALKKAGGNNIPSTEMIAPKFHVIIAEYVQQIQQKRRATKKRKLENTVVAIKEEETNS